MDSLLHPLSWLYGKLFLNHGGLGYFALLFVAALLLLWIWLMAIDKYKAEHPVSEDGPKSNAGITSPVPMPIPELSRERQSPQAEPPPAPRQQRPEQLEPAVVAKVSIVSQERIPSYDKNFPFGLKVVVQTNVVIQPVSIVFRCDGEIGKGEVEFAGDAGSIFTKIRSGVLLESQDRFLASFENPAFAPEKAMLVMLFSKTPIKVIEFFQTPFQFP